MCSSVQFSRSVRSDSATPWTEASQASLSITSARSLLRPMSTESVMPPTISCSVVPSSSRLSFPASGSFPLSRLFASGGQSIGASASVLLMHTRPDLPWRGWLALLAVTVTHLCWFLSCDVCSAATEGGTCGQTECRAKRAQCRLCSFAVKGKAVPRSQPGRAGQLCVHVLSVPMKSRKHSSSPDPFRVTVTIATRHLES